jgi:hypothetical protein
MIAKSSSVGSPADTFITLVMRRGFLKLPGGGMASNVAAAQQRSGSASCSKEDEI